MALTTVRQLIEDLQALDNPDARVYVLECGQYRPLTVETVNIADDEQNVDADGESVPVGSVVLV